MDKKIIDKIIQLIGNQTAIKAVCNISDGNPIDEKVHSEKIERARWFGLIENDSLRLTDLGKLFAVKIFFDLTDNFFEKGFSNHKIFLEKLKKREEDLDDADENWEEDDDWYEEDDDDENEDDDFGPSRRGRSRRY